MERFDPLLSEYCGIVPSQTPPFRLTILEGQLTWLVRVAPSTTYSPAKVYVIGAVVGGRMQAAVCPDDADAIDGELVCRCILFMHRLALVPPLTRHHVGPNHDTAGPCSSCGWLMSGCSCVRLPRTPWTWRFSTSSSSFEGITVLNVNVRFLYSNYAYLAQHVHRQRCTAQNIQGGGCSVLVSLQVFLRLAEVGLVDENSILNVYISKIVTNLKLWAAR